MADPVTSQFTVFLYTILTGALAGFLYDVYAGIGQILRLKKMGTLLGDVIYWFCATTLVYALLLNYNQGEVRFFVLLGVGIGALVYFRFSQRLVRNLIIKIVELLIWLINRLVTILFFPIRMLYIFLIWPFKMTGLILRKMGHLAINMAKSLMPAPIKLLYRGWVKWCAGIVNNIKREK